MFALRQITFLFGCARFGSKIGLFELFFKSKNGRILDVISDLYQMMFFFNTRLSCSPLKNISFSFSGVL